jgi:hypothetical protein
MCSSGDDEGWWKVNANTAGKILAGAFFFTVIAVGVWFVTSPVNRPAEPSVDCGRFLERRAFVEKYPEFVSTHSMDYYIIASCRKSDVHGYACEKMKYEDCQ